MPRAVDLRLDAIELAQDRRVLTATAVAPPLNFVTTEFIRDLDWLTAAVDSDDTVGAVVLTGGLPGRFLIHADPRAMAAMVELPHPFVPARVVRPFLRVTDMALRLPGAIRALERFGGGIGVGLVWFHRWKRTPLRMNRSGVVYLAAINGPALGGGHEIACDLRYAADSAALRMGQLEMLVGVIPGGGGTHRLLRMLGTARALEHILEGAPLTAAESLALGLVHRVVPDQQLLVQAQATAARLARRSPIAIAALKRCLYFGSHLPISRAFDLEFAGFLATGFSRASGRSLQPFLDDLARLGDTPELADPKPWIEGTRVDLVG